ncbi:MAG: Ig-like domain repeat protein [Terracidiphilus sp.]
MPRTILGFFISFYRQHNSFMPLAPAERVSEDRVGGSGNRRLSQRPMRAIGRRSRMAALAAMLLITALAGAQNGVFSTPQPVETQTATPISVTVTASATGTVATVRVLTLGAPNLDFTGVSGSSTCPAANLTVIGQHCTESVNFKPTAPGVRMGAVVLLDGSTPANVLGVAYLSGTGSGGLAVLSGIILNGVVLSASGNVIPVAGDGDYKEKVTNNVLATQSDLYLPSGVAVDGAGNLYIADTLHDMIRMVAAPVPPATVGVITTIAGTGEANYTGDNAQAAAATLSSPTGVALDGAGNLYIADSGNNVIRKITAATGVITTVAGNGTAGYAGDGDSATSLLTELSGPQGIAIDVSGNLYIADTDNNAIRMVSAATGDISTVVGNGSGNAGFGGDGGSATSSQTLLNLPAAVAFDTQGNIYIADSRNNRIRKVSAGNINTFAGSGVAGYTGDSGAAISAELDAPSSVAVDPAGNVYISDTQNSAIRKVSSAASPNPLVISTIAANNLGESYYPETIAPFTDVFTPVNIHYPSGIVLDSSADLYFADTFNNTVREIQSNFVALDFTATSIWEGSTSGTISQTVENDGNAPLNLPAPPPDFIVAEPDATTFVNAEVAPAPATTCPITVNPFFAAVDDTCVVGAIFAPSLSLTFASGVPEETLTPTIDIGASGDTVNSPVVIEVVGIAKPLNATEVTLTSSLNPSLFTENVTFSAKVATQTGTLTGTVTFFDGGAQIGTPVTVNSSGVATYTTGTLVVGLHTITAVYNGDALHFPSTVDASSTVAQVVNEGTTTNLITSGTPSAIGASVTFTATITATKGGGVSVGTVGGYTPTVAFTTGTGTTLCTSNVLLVGTAYQATCTTTALVQGSNAITATYSGDAAAYVAQSFATLIQDVQAASTPTLTSSANPSYYGNPVTLTLTVPTNGALPATGKVSFFLNGSTTPLNATPLLLVNTNGAGTIGMTTSTLPVGADTITATYSGDSNYAAINPLPLIQTVDQAVTATTVSAAPSPAVAGKPVVITASVKVTQGTSTPTGNVNFTDSLNGGAATPLTCTPQPTVAAPTCTTSALAAGSHMIVATYVGDTDDAGSSSAAFPLTVIAETITLSSNPNPSIYGTPVAFTIAIPTIGTTPATGTINILETGQTNPIGAVSLSGNPATATFTTSSLPVGTDVITASYLGDTNYGAIVSLAVNQVVNQVPTTTTVVAVPSPGIAGGTVNLTATVKVTQGTSTPTGNVTFTDALNGGGAVPLICTPQPTAPTAVCSTTALAPGNHMIVATYAGDTDDSTSSGSIALTVNQAVTQIVLTSTPNPSVVFSSVTFTAKVTSVGGGVPTGTVTFMDSLNGAAAVPLACTLQPAPPTATCTTTALVVGTHSVTASYSGDTNDAASTSNVIAQVVGKIPTVTGLDSATTQPPNPELILVASVVDNSPTASSPTTLPVPTGTVTFTLSPSGTLVGAATLDASGVVTLIPASLPPGTFSIIASYGGDANHDASTSVVTTLQNPAAGFSITVTPNPVTLATTQNVTVNVALTSISGFTDTIGLGCASLPAGVNCHFSTPTVALTANGQQNVALIIDTSNPLGGGTSARNAPSAGRSAFLAGVFLPLSTLFGCIFWRFRRRNARLMTVWLVLLLGVGAMLVSGCSGSFSQSSAAPGTYVIQVTGTGANSDIIHYQNVSLTITSK